MAVEPCQYRGLLAACAAMKRKLIALLDLGRVANWPTVWSNCLAAWILAGAGFSAEETMGLYELSGIFSVHVQRLWIPLLLIPIAAATLLYIGGVALNDAFDANFDKEHRSERPGAVRSAWR